MVQFAHENRRSRRCREPSAGKNQPNTGSSWKAWASIWVVSAASPRPATRISRRAMHTGVGATGFHGSPAKRRTDSRAAVRVPHQPAPRSPTPHVAVFLGEHQRGARGPRLVRVPKTQPGTDARLGEGTREVLRVERRRVSLAKINPWSHQVGPAAANSRSLVVQAIESQAWDQQIAARVRAILRLGAQLREAVNHDHEGEPIAGS